MLLIEDICEPPRKIHRCLTQLELSGQLRKCAGLIFAHFTKCGFPKEKKLVYEAFAGALDGPVIAGFPFGHTTPTASLIYGEPLSVDSSGTVSLWR
jgi:muramoyltetrapeptide carboxypeptidase